MKIILILHPSLQSKAANHWHVDAHKQLDDLGITPYLIDAVYGIYSLNMFEVMTRALELATEALHDDEVPVGCVFTVNGKTVAESRNTVNVTCNPTRHAEMNCIDVVMKYCVSNNIDYRTYFKNVCVYVTVEPCIMCAAALSSLQVRDVVYGCANDRFGGKTVVDVSEFYEYNYKLTGDVMANEAMDLLKQFYKGSNPKAPESKAKKKKYT